MTKINRRTAMTSAVVAGATVAATGVGTSNASEYSHLIANEPDLTDDQKYIMEAGLDEKEAEAWKKIADAAAAFFALPELHPLDNKEVATAVHVIQNKLLGRPTYRKYLKLAKAGYEKRKREKKQ